MATRTTGVADAGRRPVKHVLAWLWGVQLVALCCPALGQTSLPTDPTGRLNPENLSRVCDIRIGAYLTSIETCYELGAGQRARVRDRLEQLKQDQIRYSLTLAAERALLHDQALVERREVSKRARNSASQPVDVLALCREMPVFVRLEAMKAGEPLFTVENVLQEVEKLLPAEQATAGAGVLFKHRRSASGRWQLGIIASCLESEREVRIFFANANEAPGRSMFRGSASSLD